MLEAVIIVLNNTRKLLLVAKRNQTKIKGHKITLTQKVSLFIRG